MDLKKIELNTIYNGKLKNNDYSHNYSIFLEENKYYFIELININDYEFNLKIFDSCYNKINTNDSINNITSKLITYNDEELEKELEEHNKYIDDNYYNSTSSEETDTNKEDKKNDVNLVLYHNNKTDNIEIVLEVIENPISSKDTNNYINAISKIKFREYNNKIYLKVKKTDEYIINVRSEYENEEGEYSLNIKEVEDISMILNSNLKINEIKTLKFKKKYYKEKIYINLDPNTDYMFYFSSKHLKIFILGEGKTYTNSNDDLSIFFTTNLGGNYIIEVISNKNNIVTDIKLELIEKIFLTKNELFPSDDESSITMDKDYSYDLKDEDKIYNEIKMKDLETDEIFKLIIINGKLVVEKVIQ